MSLSNLYNNNNNNNNNNFKRITYLIYNTNRPYGPLQKATYKHIKHIYKCTK